MQTEHIRVLVAMSLRLTDAVINSATDIEHAVKGQEALNWNLSTREEYLTEADRWLEESYKIKHPATDLEG